MLTKNDSLNKKLFEKRRQRSISRIFGFFVNDKMRKNTKQKALISNRKTEDADELI